MTAPDPPPNIYKYKVLMYITVKRHFKNKQQFINNELALEILEETGWFRRVAKTTSLSLNVLASTDIHTIDNKVVGSNLCHTYSRDR